MAKKVIGNNFNSGIVGNQITGIKGTNTFSIGNAFIIKTNDNERDVRNYNSLITNFSMPITLNDIKSSGKDINDILFTKTSVKFNFDKTDIKNYALFGSLSEYFRVTVESILDKFPASLYIDNLVDQAHKINILDYTYDSVSNSSTFKIPKICVNNKFDINYTISNSNKKYKRDLIKNYIDYNIFDMLVDKEYPILGYSGDTNSQYVYIKSAGNIFPLASGGTLSRKFHIKPNYNEVENFFLGLNDLEAYLLNREGTPKYSCQFTSVKLSDEGKYYMLPENFVWETSDGYNIDYNNSKFNSYSTALNELGIDYDAYKTNLISRFLTSSSVKEFDTADQKLDKLLKIYGREFDEINKYINSLANVYKLNYNKKNDTPDVLIKNLAKTLGWEVFDFIKEDDLIKRYLGEDEKPIFSGNSKNLTPSEVDIELWRRMLLNTSYLFKSKGTRKSIEFIFRLIGAPEYIIDFNEHVYLMNGKVKVDQLTADIKLVLPVDEHGYPNFPMNSQDKYYQMKGGWITETLTNQINSPVGVHIGEYDKGKSYYSDLKGLESITLTKVVDNKKSWSSGTDKIDLNKVTNYTSDNRLIINNKEVDIYIDGVRGIEYDIYRRNYNDEFPINIALNTSPLPNSILTNINVDSLTFYDYLKFIYGNLINVKNRKVITDNFGGGYSSLKFIYEEYNKLPNAITIKNLTPFLDKINGIWLQIVEQFIPSTTIWDGGNKYRNTIFDRQKFNYKHGINDGSEFVKKQISSGVVTIVSSPEIYSKVNTGVKGNVSKITSFSMSLSSSLISGAGGLTNNKNVLRVVENITSRIINLIPPNYSISGTSKIVSGLTTPTVWETKNGLKPLIFNFSGDTSGLNLGAEPIYEFGYKIYPRLGQVFSTQSIQTNKFSTQIFSGQTGSGNKIINGETFNTLTENEYLIKGYYNYTSVALNNLTGTTDSIVGSDYRIYNSSTDWYFVQLATPEKPIINTQSMFKASALTNFQGVRLVNKSLVVDTEEQVNFVLQALPIGDMIVAINGVSLSQSKFNDFRDNGEFFIDRISFTGGVIIKLQNGLSIIRKDTIVTNYVIDTGNSNSQLSSVSYKVTSPIVSNNGSQGAGLILNSTSSKYEYWFNYPVNPVNSLGGDMIVMVNGLILSLGFDWGYSASSPYKIVFNNPINVNDVLFFISGTGDGSGNTLSGNTLNVSINDREYSKAGIYRAEIANINDLNFSTVLYSSDTPYITGNTLANITYSIPSIIISGSSKSYLLRVKSTKKYKTLVGENLESISYSSTVKFLTDNTNIF